MQKLDKYSESKEFIDKLLALNPNMPEALVRLGNICIINKKYKEAIKKFDTAIAIKFNYAYAYHRRGNAKYKLSDYRGAIFDYDKAIKFKSDYAAVYNNRGNAKSKLSEYNDAIEDYDQAIAHTVENPAPAAYGGRGDARFDSPKPDLNRAIADYTKAIEYGLYDPTGYVVRGNAQLKLENDDDAIADYTTAITLLKWMKKHGGDKYDKAIKLLERLKIWWKDKPEQYAMVIALSEHLKKHREGKYKKVIEENPSLYAMAYKNRGDAKCKKTTILVQSPIIIRPS